MPGDWTNDMSAAPTPYTPSYDFEDFQAANPNTPLPGDKVDAEFAAINTAMDTTQSRLAEIQNSDGTLKNASVGTEQLQSDVVIGVRAATNWATATVYSKYWAVYQSNNVYVCLVAHTSGTFATDLAAAKWQLVLNLGQYVDAASSSATAAASSASSASSSASSASTSASSASTSLASFNNVYLGASASAPSLDSDGSALDGGELYFNTTDKFLYIYDLATTSWKKAADAISATRALTYANGDGATTVFAVTYDVGKIDVYVAGVRQRVDTGSQSPGANYDCGAANGTQVTFAAAPASGTRNIQFNVLGTFSVSSVASGSIDTAQLADGAVTPAKNEPGAHWWADSSTVGVAHAVTHNPAWPSYASGGFLRYRAGLGNHALSSITPTSITSSSTVATVNYTSHGLAVDDIVFVSGCTQTEYNGLHVVATVPNANSFTYFFAGSATSPATGSPLYRHAAPGGSTAYTGGLTVNANSLGAKDMRRIRGHKLAPGDIYTDDEIMGTYNGTLFRLFNPPAPQCVTAVQCNTASTTAYDGFTTEIPLTTIMPFLVAFRAEVTNTASCTLRIIDTLGASVSGTVYKRGLTALNPGDIIGGRWGLYLWTGHGAATGGLWEMMSPAGDVAQSLSTAILEDQKTSGTSGGTSVSGAWTTRTLNTEASDSSGIVTLSANAFTPVAGTYNVTASAPFWATDMTRIRLRNSTAGTTVACSQPVKFSNDGGVVLLDCVMAANGTDAYVIQYYAQSAGADRLGPPYADAGETEVYTRVKLQKIG